MVPQAVLLSLDRRCLRERRREQDDAPFLLVTSACAPDVGASPAAGLSRTGTHRLDDEHGQMLMNAPAGVDLYFCDVTYQP
jgi:hypothetical protein